MNEFELIEKFFHRAPKFSSTRLGIGDDCALIQPSHNKVIAVSTDALVLDTHFFADADPYQLGRKALAVNLSDIAAMTAKPLAFLLSLTLPEINDIWLKAFSQGLLSIADEFHLDLIGGNTTRGPLNINITIIGEVDEHQAPRRDRAKTDDDIYVTGELGGAALALQLLQNHKSLPSSAALLRFNAPTPRVYFAQDLLGLTHAMIDISDGLAQDLQHILIASGVGATLLTPAIPVFPGSNLALALNGGEDYELCFTAPNNVRSKIDALAQKHQLTVTRIGSITANKKLILLDESGQPIDHLIHGYRHF